MIVQQPHTGVRIVEAELSNGLSGLGLDGGSPARCMTFVRLHGAPLGVVDHPSSDAIRTPSGHAAAIWESLQDEITSHLAEDGLNSAGQPWLDQIASVKVCPRMAPVTEIPFTVIIATHNRPDDLARCVNSVLALEYGPFEIVVVDNAPSSDAAEVLIREQYAGTGKVTYVRDDTPGLAIAHNRGLREVRTPLVAFTDDDVTVDRAWLARLNAAFQADKDIGCVTGLIFPSELETDAQLWAEAYWGFRKGFRPKAFDLQTNRMRSPIYPYTAGMFGSGANMAFRTSVLLSMGGFDPALGTGTRAKGGDDLAAFFETIKRGHGIAYEPGAIVYHPHHREFANLRKQAYGYGAGLTAYLMKVVIDRPWLLLDMARRLPAAIAYLLGPHSPKNQRRPAGLPPELVRSERAGMLRGGFLYLYSRWETRSLRGKIAQHMQ